MASLRTAAGAIGCKAHLMERGALYLLCCHAQLHPEHRCLLQLPTSWVTGTQGHRGSSFTMLKQACKLSRCTSTWPRCPEASSRCSSQ